MQMKTNSQTHKLKGSKTIPHKMLSLDPFSQWLGIEILECEIGRCKVGMTIRKEMLNSMQKAHGGITYSLADTAFGFSANTYGKYAVSIETSINHIEALDRKSTRLNSSHVRISYAVFCLKKKI